MDSPSPRKLAFVTIGQAPRHDVVPDIVRHIGRPVAHDVFGALDELSEAQIAELAPGPDDISLCTRTRSGREVVVAATGVARRIEQILGCLEHRGFDLIVILTTGLFRDFTSAVPVLNGQRVIDSWMDALVMADQRIGMIYPFEDQPAEWHYSDVVHDPLTVTVPHGCDRLDEAARRLRGCDLIVLNSVTYDDDTARRLRALTTRPVVPLRRVLAGAIRFHLAQLDTARRQTAADLLARLPQAHNELTPREREVIVLVMNGHSNKRIGRELGISHRTVEIHRARAFAKLGASSVADLIRRILMLERPLADT